MPTKNKVKKIIAVAQGKTKDDYDWPPVKVDRLFSINQDVSIGEDLTGVVQGYYSATDVIVRVRIVDISKKSGDHLKSLKCLTPNGSISRLYSINQNELARHNEQKGKAVKTPKKQAQHVR